MKRLILFRHAKSDWDASYSGDHARPLNERGRKAAHRMGVFLAQISQVPPRVVISSATRAQETVDLASRAGGWKCEVDVTDALYGASVTSSLEVLRGLEDAEDAVLFVGHEPTWSELAGALIGDGRLHFPTAAMARLDFGCGQWSGIELGGGSLAWLVTPKLLASVGLDS